MLSMTPSLARAALDAAPDALLVLDEQGIIRYANKQVSTLFGFEHDDIIGTSVEQLIPERFASGHAEHRRRYIQAMRPRPMGQGLDLYARRSDGSEFPAEISLSPIQDGERRLVAAAIRDVSERKRVEAELIAARQAAENARQAADRANQAKSRFLTTASHDLRQPLQSLALLNGSLRRLTIDAEASQAVTQQELAIGSMSNLLNTLLDIGKLESGTITARPTDFSIADVLRELEAEFAPMAARKGLLLQMESAGEAAHSDPALVEQVLRNLISNAIKYTRDGSVTVRCRRAVDRVCIEIADTGVGIPADQIPYIYDEFYQVTASSNAQRDGYGLGLSIVLRIVQLLGAELSVKSEVNSGSTFTLYLTGSAKMRPSSQTARAIAPSPRGAKPYRGRVLLVEDDPAVQAATKMLLKVEGYTVVLATTPAEAESAAQTQPIDLLITDYHLGHSGTGLQVIERVRRVANQNIKAILMTGDTSSAVREISETSSLRIVSKPIQAEALLQIIESLADTETKN